MSKIGLEMSNCNNRNRKSYISGPIFSSKISDYSYKKNDKKFSVGLLTHLFLKMVLMDFMIITYT